MVGGGGGETQRSTTELWEYYLSVDWDRGRLVGWWGWGGLVGWGGVVAVPSLGLWGVDGGALVGDVGDEASLVVSVVGDDLHPAVGKVHPVGAVDLAVRVLVLGLLEGSAGVLVLDAILVGVGLGRKLLLVLVGGGLVGWGWGRMVRSGGGLVGGGGGGGGPSAKATATRAEAAAILENILA